MRNLPCSSPPVVPGAPPRDKHTAPARSGARTEPSHTGAKHLPACGRAWKFLITAAAQRAPPNCERSPLCLPPPGDTQLEWNSSNSRTFPRNGTMQTNTGCAPVTAAAPYAGATGPAGRKHPMPGCRCGPAAGTGDTASGSRALVHARPTLSVPSRTRSSESSASTAAPGLPADRRTPPRGTRVPAGLVPESRQPGGVRCPGKPKINGPSPRLDVPFCPAPFRPGPGQAGADILNQICNLDFDVSRQLAWGDNAGAATRRQGRAGPWKSPTRA